MEYSDPAMVTSNYKRNEKDRYWTEPWVTQALLDTIAIPKNIWEPACGRGDIAHVLFDNGHGVFASDIDIRDYERKQNVNIGIIQRDFLHLNNFPAGIDGIVTNPPYHMAQEFIEHALIFNCFVAMLLRSEFKHAKTRRHLFGECSKYVGEVVLTSRPRWDWWFRDKPKASPRHNYSWFTWGTNCLLKHPYHYQKFHYRD